MYILHQHLLMNNFYRYKRNSKYTTWFMNWFDYVGTYTKTIFNTANIISVNMLNIKQTFSYVYNEWQHIKQFEW